MAESKTLIDLEHLELLRAEIELMKRLIKVKQRLLVVGARKYPAKGPRKRVLKVEGKGWSGP